MFVESYYKLWFSVPRENPCWFSAETLPALCQCARVLAAHVTRDCFIGQSSSTTLHLIGCVGSHVRRAELHHCSVFLKWSVIVFGGLEESHPDETEELLKIWRIKKYIFFLHYKILNLQTDSWKPDLRNGRTNERTTNSSCQLCILKDCYCCFWCGWSWCLLGFSWCRNLIAEYQYISNTIRLFSTASDWKRCNMPLTKPLPRCLE